MITNKRFISGEPFLSQVSQYIIETNSHQLPDIGHINIFIANKIAADQLAYHLSGHNKYNALIPPFIGSMNQWIANNIPLANTETSIISEQSRHLLFLDAISQHPDLFRPENNWQVCDALLNLFDELSSNNIIEPYISASQWEQTLNDAYGRPTINIQNLKTESNIIYTLWKAWHEQMKAMNIMDKTSAYASQLKNHSAFRQDSKFYIIGPEQLSNLELAWCQRHSELFSFDYLIQNNPPDTKTETTTAPSHNITEMISDIDLIYDDRTPLTRRYTKLSNMDALIRRLSIFSARSYEQEAQAIELQVRSWLIEKKTNIAIVTEDRKIARRVRALLDRADIQIQDTAGWALSTTSASTTVERWLECIEEDFPHQALLDLLKSPFFCHQDTRETHLQQVYHFEHDIIIHENVPRDINRYQKALQNRKSKLESWPTERFDNINQLLNSIDCASQRLKQLYSSSQFHHPEQYIRALIQSLNDLNITTLFENDIAGRDILSALNNMLGSLKLATPKMTWKDFRTWLAYSLEKEQLIINNDRSAVTFMNFKQAQYCSFDCIIIAGANKDKLPGSVEQTAFFNQSVKSSLGLKDWNFKKNYFFYRFKCLLDSASKILITYRHEHDGEWLPASPWVTSLEDMLKISGNYSFNNKQLTALVNQNIYITDNNYRDQINIASQPAPVLPDELKPDTYSANRLQKVINCPYQFFTSVALSLKAADHITEELKKSEYGEKIHAILYAFHNQQHSTALAFTGPVNITTREPAIEHLTKISRHIFGQNIEDNIQHRGWLKRWLKTIPDYIDWQIKWQETWAIDQLESKHNINLYEQITLNGRLDRIDKFNNEYAIIDYKTGTPPSNSQIRNGEDIQLLSYAALLDHAQAVHYLKLDQGEVKSAAFVDGDSLNELNESNKQRMINMVKEIQHGASLPAWGDVKTCEYCDSQGLCRKQIWDNA